MKRWEQVNSYSFLVHLRMLFPPSVSRLSRHNRKIGNRKSQKLISIPTYLADIRIQPICSYCYHRRSTPDFHILYNSIFSVPFNTDLDTASLNRPQKTCRKVIISRRIWGCQSGGYVRVLISLWFFLIPICSTTKRIFLGWVKEVRTTKS
jgi:hypothetical protein